MDNGIKKINEVVAYLDGIEPLIEFKEPMNEISHEMNYALAQMFANKGYRSYLENNLNAQIKSLMRAETTNDIFYLKGRIITLKELLIVAKRAFEKISEIDKRKIK